MTVAAILREKGHDVAAVAPDTPVADIARLLADRRIGAVLVRETGGRLAGIVSERDIVRCLARDGAAVLAQSAASLMTTVLHTARPETTVEQAMSMMTDHRVRHLPVLEGGALVGLISIGDVVKRRIADQTQEVDSLKAYVAGSV